MLINVLAHIYLASARVRRLYCLALGLLAAGTGILAMYMWFGALQAAHLDLQDRRETLGNMLRIIEAGEKSKSTMTASEQASQRIFHQGASRAVVSAGLQSWLGSAVQESGAQLQSIENQVLSEADSKTSIGLSASIIGNWKAVQAVIFRIETAQPMLTIQSMDLQSNAYGMSEDVEPIITMQIAIRGAISEPGT